jgi:hypothetical protein
MLGPGGSRTEQRGRGQGGGHVGGDVGGEPGRRRRASVWRGPLGVVALAVAATGYWSTVAWMVAARTNSVLVDAFDRAELDRGQGDQDADYDQMRVWPPLGDYPCPYGTVPRDRFDISPPGSLLRIPGHPPYSFGGMGPAGVRQLGLATGQPNLQLLDLNR